MKKELAIKYNAYIIQQIELAARVKNAPLDCNLFKMYCITFRAWLAIKAALIPHVTGTKIWRVEIRIVWNCNYKVGHLLEATGSQRAFSTGERVRGGGGADALGKVLQRARVPVSVRFAPVGRRLQGLGRFDWISPSHAVAPLLRTRAPFRCRNGAAIFLVSKGFICLGLPMPLFLRGLFSA